MSGYDEKDRLSILKGGFNTYNNLKDKVAKGKRPFYRPASFKKEERQRTKKDKLNNWYRNKDNKFTTVLFVEPTPNN